MEISSDYFIFIDLFIILIYAINIVVAYRKGLVYEVLHLVLKIVSVIVSYKLCTYLADAYPIITIDNQVLSKVISIEKLCNDALWFVIIYIILNTLVAIILPLFKFVSKIPIVGLVNRIGGILFGIICATITVLCLSFLLSLPIVKNGNEIKEKTLIRYVSTYTDMAISTLTGKLNIEDITSSN